MLFRAILAALVAFTFSADLLRARTFRGTMQGTGRDSSRSAVPSAQITATSEQTRSARQSLTGAPGNYLLTELTVGSYTVTGAKSRFQKQVVTDIEEWGRDSQPGRITVGEIICKCKSCVHWS